MSVQEFAEIFQQNTLLQRDEDESTLYKSTTYVAFSCDKLTKELSPQKSGVTALFPMRASLDQLTPKIKYVFFDHWVPMSASSLLGVAPDQLRCVQEAGCAAMGAASSAHLVQALESWTTLAKLKLHHIQPSWSIASQCKLARSSTFSALQLTERDGITLISQTGTNWVSCHWPQVGQTPEIEEARVRRQLTGWGVEEGHLLKLDFVAESATTLQGGPTLWAGHWRQHATAAH